MHAVAISPSISSRLDAVTLPRLLGRHDDVGQRSESYRDPMAKKKTRRRAATPPVPPGMERIRPPKKELRKLLQLLVAIPAAAEVAVAGQPLPKGEKAQRLMMFDAGVFNRACNSLKVVRLLCAELHWEFAVTAVRQLFELVVNLEYLAAQPDREAAVFRYSKYGLLQLVQKQRLELLYQQKTGRPIDEKRLASLEQMLDQTFPEFRRVGRTGHVHFLKSWTGLTTRSLAEKSSHRLRKDQWAGLYSAWSEQTHAAPAVLLGTMLPGATVETVVAQDLTESVQAITMAITLFFELWLLLPHLPPPEPNQLREWSKTMLDEARKLGAPIPILDPASDDEQETARAN